MSAQTIFQDAIFWSVNQSVVCQYCEWSIHYFRFHSHSLPKLVYNIIIYFGIILCWIAAKSNRCMWNELRFFVSRGLNFGDRKLSHTKNIQKGSTGPLNVLTWFPNLF